MLDRAALEPTLATVIVEAAVFALRPDYRAVLIAADGLHPGASDPESDALLHAVEQHARSVLRNTPVEQLPHVAAWRDAYRAFGAKPQRTRNSLEALLRRAPDGLPRVNRLTDVYNAISVLHQLPIGGEDLDSYSGPARLIRATGEESFDVVAAGHPTVEHPEPGEVVWRDDVGVTCRRWNWRQGVRTRLHDDTTAALFIIDVLDPVTLEQADAAAADLAEQLRRLGQDVRSATRTIATREREGSG